MNNPKFELYSNPDTSRK